MRLDRVYYIHLKNNKMPYILFLFFVLLCNVNVFAGTSCQQSGISQLVFLNATDHAIALKNILNRESPKVAIIARIGSDTSKYGIKYTHAAFVMKQNNNWHVIHLLNECGTDKSFIYNQGLLNFYLDDLHTMETQVMIPTRKLQTMLECGLQSKIFLALHDMKYSMLSNPFSIKNQNSNQWILESIACGLQNLQECSRKASQEYLMQTSYEGFKIKLSSLESMFGSIFKANISLNSYSSKNRANNTYSVVTVSSIEEYLEKEQLIQKKMTFK